MKKHRKSIISYQHIVSDASWRNKTEFRNDKSGPSKENFYRKPFSKYYNLFMLISNVVLTVGIAGFLIAAGLDRFFFYGEGEDGCL